MKDSTDTPEMVGDLMTVDLISVLAHDRVGRARELLRSSGLHAVLVMDGNDVLGIVTSVDLVDDWTDDEMVLSAMSPGPTLIDTAATISEAAEMMLSQRVHHLVVSDEREVIGILSSFDLLEALVAPTRVRP